MPSIPVYLQLDVAPRHNDEGPLALIRLAGCEANQAGLHLPLARLVRTAHDCLLGTKSVEEKEADHFRRLAWNLLQGYVAGIMEESDPRQLENLMVSGSFDMNVRVCQTRIWYPVRLGARQARNP